MTPNDSYRPYTNPCGSAIWSIVFLTLLLISPSLFFAQPSKYMQPLILHDSMPVPNVIDALPTKKFGKASVALLLAEVTPWAVDNYIRKVDYTQISLQTIGYNLSPAHWAWDGDGFTTNQFGHPYHGSLFYNAFRSNGYNFWQSSLAVFAGSYIWETVAENQAPAPNDFINTGFGGVILGEMTHRLANKIINNRTVGFRRQAGEVAAFIINPMNGFGRIRDGRWGRLQKDAVARDTSKIATEIDIGLRQFRNDNSEGKFGLYARMKFMYGTPGENLKTPFSNMFINAEFGKDDSSAINVVSIYGSLSGWKLPGSQNSNLYTLLTANYDYIRNSAFFYSAQSVKFNLYSVFDLTKKLKINTVAGAGIVLLAAVPDAHGFKSRYYNYCTGVGFNGSCMLSIAGHFYLGISYRGGWLKTVNGNSSHYFLHATTGEVRYRISKQLSVCAEPGYFTLHGNYTNYKDVHKIYPYLRFSIRYHFSFQ